MSLGKPDDEIYDSAVAAGPLREAVETLCQEAGRTPYEMEGKPLREISALAQSFYGSELPPFWRNWIDWNQDDLQQPMGDL